MESDIFKPVKNKSLSKMVMERIKEALIQKSLKPGDRLPTETELCESLGVGKSSVREAVKMLEVLGVVEARQGEGTFVARRVSETSVNPLVYQLLIDDGGVSDILELRRMFEPSYTLLAMEKATQEDVARLREVHGAFAAAVERGTQTAEDDMAFHYAVLEATHNPFIIRIGRTIMQLFQVSIGESMKEIPQRAVADHEKILQAFLARDPRALRQAVLESFDGWASMLNKD